MRVDFQLRLQNRDSQDDTGRHRENLLQAENNKEVPHFTIHSRLSRIEKSPVYALISIIKNQKSLVCP